MLMDNQLRSSFTRLYHAPRGIKYFEVQTLLQQLLSLQTSFYGMPVVPWGIERLLEYMKTHYHNPPVSIVENGQYNSLNCNLYGIYSKQHTRAIRLTLKNNQYFTLNRICS